MNNSNSNTIAIAVASLLVGGVAMATYQNNRDDAPGETAGSAAMSLADDSKHGPLDNAVSARGLDYAPVLAVRPVTESQPVYARVLSVDPIRETSTTSAPRQICEDRLVQERLPERDGNVGGTVAGAVIGGLVGNRLGREVHDSRDRRNLATVGGAVAGGFIGRRIDRNHVGGQVAQRTVRECRTVDDTASSSRTVGYDVTYRNADGTTGSMRSDSRPGERMRVGTEQHTVGYDVTYRYAGQEHAVRMDQHPGDRLPVLDGRIAIDTVAALAPPAVTEPR